MLRCDLAGMAGPGGSVFDSFGAYADMVLLDQHMVIDRATVDKPAVPAAGIDETWVNGRTAYAPARGAADGSGRLLRRAGV